MRFRLLAVATFVSFFAFGTHANSNNQVNVSSCSIEKEKTGIYTIHCQAKNTSNQKISYFKIIFNAYKNGKIVKQLADVKVDIAIDETWSIEAFGSTESFDDYEIASIETN